jgi:hypothetical protein
MQRAEGEAWDLQSDLRDVQIYLNRTFRDIGWIPFSVDRHYGSREDEIAYVVIALSEQVVRRHVRSQAEAALRHLGYKIEPLSGADVYDVVPYMGENVSAHETIQALARFKGLANPSLWRQATTPS